MIMALSRNYYKLCLSFAVAAVFFFSLTLLPPKSGGIQTSRDNEQLRKMVLGSRPPACVNKCKSCKPCEATLVIPPHQSRTERVNHQQLSSHREDDSYYLLSWKCRCGNKLYQP